MQEYDLDNFEAVARIVVIGVGGAGNNAVNRMIDEEIPSVEFYVANTDRQALSTSKARNRLVLGNDLTQGLGSGGEPSVGREAAEASAEDIRNIVRGANMVFIAAGMGGGTGTGAAPVIARIAKEEGALTVAIVTRPFEFEGKKRIINSVEGLNELRDAVDSIIVLSNDKLLMVNGTNSIQEAFAESDRVLAQSVKTVTDLILMPAVINLDFADVRNTLKDSGVALIGFGMGQGPNKSIDAANGALNSPLLDTPIHGARRAICAITCGPNVSLYEAQDCVERIIEASGDAMDVKFGVSINEELSDQMLVSVIASDFADEFDFKVSPKEKVKPEVRPVQESVFEENHPEFKEDHVEEKKEESEEEFGENFLTDFLKENHIE